MRRRMSFFPAVLFVVLLTTSICSAGTVDIVSFNDFHGIVTPSERNPGMVRFAGALREAIDANSEIIVVSAGDSFQGSAMSNLTYGEPITALYKRIGVVASAVGNHEFDWGLSHFTNWAADGDFVFLAANIVEKETGEQVAWAKPYCIVEKGGVRVAFIGLSTIETPLSTRIENVESLEFKKASETARFWVEFLTAENSLAAPVDFIILLTHIASFQNSETGEISGRELEDLVTIPGIDGIITAHSHQFVSGRKNGIPIVQAGSYGRGLAHLTIDVTTRTVTPSVDVLSKRIGTLPHDSEALEIYRHHEDRLKPMITEQIGVATADFSHSKDTAHMTALGAFVCRTLRERFDAVVALQNGGSIRRSLSRGPITIGDLYEILPFDDGAVIVSLSGSDLKSAIEHGLGNPDIPEGQYEGLKIKIDPDQPFGDRVQSMKVKQGKILGIFTRWREVQPEQTYRVVINEFMYAGGRQIGGDGYNFSAATDVVFSNIPIREILVDAIRREKIISP